MTPSATRWLGAAALSIAIVASGCGGAKPTAKSATTTVPSTTTTSLGFTSVPPGGSTTSSVAASTTTTVKKTPTCATAQLAVVLGAGNGAAGSSYYQLTFRNTGTATCTLYGYPGVSYVVGAARTQVGASATTMPDSTGATEKVVDLAPGASAHSTLREVNAGNFDPSLCVSTSVAGLLVYPPGETVPAFVTQATTGCTNSATQLLQVSYVVSP